MNDIQIHALAHQLETYAQIADAAIDNRRRDGCLRLLQTVSGFEAALRALHKNGTDADREQLAPLVGKAGRVVGALCNVTGVE